MPVPKEWPTLENIKDAKDRVRHMNARLTPTMTFDYWEAPRFVTAAEWAVTVRPQLEALVAELDEWARAAAANKDAIAGTFVGLSYRLNEIIATPHEEHEETR